MKNFVTFFLLLFTALAWQGCATDAPAPVSTSVDPVVGLWNCDSDNEGAAKAVIFEVDHYALTKGGVVARWNVEAPNFYKINHTTSPVELFYLADAKTLYLLGYGGNSSEIISIVNKGYPLDDLHQKGLLPLLIKYKRAASPKPRS